MIIKMNSNKMITNKMILNKMISKIMNNRYWMSLQKIMIILQKKTQ